MLLGHLLARELIDELSVVDGEVKVTDVSRRNRNVRVTTTLGKSYFVKQALGEERAMTIAREAAFLRLVAESPSSSRLSRCLPTVRDWDAERGTLVFDLMPESRSLAVHQRRAQRWPASLAEQAAGALAALHSWQPPSPGAAPAVIDDYGPPWMLSIHEPEIRVLDTMSGAELEIVRIVQGAASIGTALAALRDGWQASAIIHGDVKWDNFVVFRPPGSRAWRLLLVDWEMVQFGDPLWDAAAFLGQYLDAWIASIPVVDYSGLSLWPPAQVPLERLQPAMRRFWRAYARGVGLAGAGRVAALERVARYAATHLIQSCFEAEQVHPKLTNTSVLRLQVAQNMLQRPLVAAASLFGVTD